MAEPVSEALDARVPAREGADAAAREKPGQGGAAARPAPAPSAARARGRAAEPLVGDAHESAPAELNATMQPEAEPQPAPRPEVEADNYPALRRACKRYLSPADLKQVEDAYLFAADYHAAQRRRSGEPYINHPVEVATILAHDLRMDADTICAALLHDTVEDTAATKGLVRENFGDAVAELVDGVTKLTTIQMSTTDEKQAMNLRKMFLAMSRDIRVVIIKLADRLHNMRTLSALKPERQRFKARETMDVYAPLADRLGISSIKWELEDLSFMYLEPEEFQRVARMVQESREQREEVTQEAIKVLDDELRRAGIGNFTITGRAKHLWSIWQKMRRKSKEFSDIYDLIALRVITQSVRDCYTTLGSVHSLWHPLPGRFKDYIANPKPNLYQSIHTTVVGPNARTLEIQIRTVEMHEQAEYGIAAHWLYKSSGNSQGNMTREDRTVDSQISRIRRSLDWAAEEDIEDPREYLRNLRVDLFEDEIFVFTPAGDVMSLRQDSTPLDFAYQVHTEVGNHCVGAKVNGSVVPLTYHLEMGDRVEILTNKNSHPSADWLNIVATPSARAKIRRYFSSANKSIDAEQGRSMLATELRKAGHGISTRRSVRAIAEVCEQLKFREPDDLFAAIGAGKLSAKQAAHRVESALAEAEPAQSEAHEETAPSFEPKTVKLAVPRPHRSRPKGKTSRSGVVVKGDPDLFAHLAKCCNPVAGDEIVGFITRGRGVSVHRANCPNARALMSHPERMIEVAWDTSGATEFQVEIVVEASDRIGLLKDVTIAIGEAGGNIIAASTQTTRTGIARLRFTLEISAASLLDPLLGRVSRVPSVFDARRIMPGEGGSEMRQRARY